MSKWRDVRTMTPIADDADFVATQTIPADSIMELEDESETGTGTYGFSFKAVLLDVNNDIVLPGSMTFDVEIIETDVVTVSDPAGPTGATKNLPVIAKGDNRAGVSAYSQFTAGGLGGSTMSGGVTARMTNFANIPGAATQLVLRGREV